MILNEIKNPQFLKNLNEKELSALADEIRAQMIETVAKNGGHLSSNLSMTDLVIALHYVFDAPNDTILFDSGYQCYAHKILTGRIDGFKDLRRNKGVSGYTDPKESPYDHLKATHPSDALAIALGMAYAREENASEEIIVIIGDEAIKNGIAMETIQKIAESDKKIIIILNDNTDYRSLNQGGFSKFVTNIRYSKEYTTIKKTVKTTMAKSDLGIKVFGVMGGIKNSLKHKIIKGSIFTDLGIEYEGPVDGHNMSELLSVLKKIKNNNGPIVVHVLTKKGKGYEPLESGLKIDNSLSKPFLVKSGRNLNDIPNGYIDSRQMIIKQIMSMMKEHQFMTIINKDDCDHSYQSLFAACPQRIINAGIYEDASIGIACGLSLKGIRPVILMSANYVSRCYDQLHNLLIKNHHKATLVLFDCGLNAYEGEGHQGIFDKSFLGIFPDVVIAEGNSYQSISALFRSSFDYNGLFILRIENAEYQMDKHQIQINYGKWEKAIYDENNLMTIITYGLAVNELRVDINNNALPINVVNALYLNPIDYELLDEIIANRRPVVVYEMDYIYNGLGEKIRNYFHTKGAKNKLSIMGLRDDNVINDTRNSIKRSKRMDFASIIKEIKQL